MRHLKHTAKLGRNCGHRKALLVNLACSIIEHEQVQTTIPRAKEVRRLVDRLISFAKKGTDHHRRLTIAKLKVNTPSDKALTKKLVVEKLFSDLAKRFEKRNGGYTRIIRTRYRIGDGAEACLIQLDEADPPAAAEEKKEEAAK